MELLVRVLLALLAVAFVAYPLVTQTRDEEDEAEDADLQEGVDDLHRRKESAFSAIRELEFDYRTGKLSQEDFHELDARYRAEAVDLINAIEGYEETGILPVFDDEEYDPDYEVDGGPAEELDLELLQVLGEADDEPEEESEPWCPECGTEMAAHHRFCPGCGAEVAQGGCCV